MRGPTKHPGKTLEHFYDDSVSETKQEVMAGPGNVYGFLFENNSASASIFVQVFDKVAADVTVGVTAPDYTFKVLAGSTFGRDPLDYGLRYHGQGLTIAVTSTRTGAAAPASAATVNVWTRST
jgi:hypothetical protein